MATREFFQARKGKRTWKKVVCDGQEIWLRSLMSGERSDVNLMFRGDKGEDMRPDAAQARTAVMICRSIVEKEGSNTLEYEGTEEDMALFIDQEAKLMDPIQNGLMELSYSDTEEFGKK